MKCQGDLGGIHRVDIPIKDKGLLAYFSINQRFFVDMQITKKDVKHPDNAIFVQFAMLDDPLFVLEEFDNR